MTAYKTWLHLVLKTILQRLKAYPDLTGVVKEWRIGVKSKGIEYNYPAVVVMPLQDLPEDGETEPRDHMLDVDVEVATRYIGDAKDADDFDKGYLAHEAIAGDVHDALAAERDTHLQGQATNISVSLVDFQFAAQEGRVLYSSLIRVRVWRKEP